MPDSRPEGERCQIVFYAPERNIGNGTARAGTGWLPISDDNGTLAPAYRQARREAFSQSVARLQQASGATVSTLLKIMVDPSAASTRVCRQFSAHWRAADILMQHKTGIRPAHMADRSWGMCGRGQVAGGASYLL